MTYSTDLRERMMKYVREGGSKAEAARRYAVSEATSARRRRKIDWEALESHVQQHPEATIKDRAKQFAVNPSTIWCALKELQITSEKTVKVSRKRP